ncbi:MAG: hypothetical protein KDA91_14975 [Planctomycetaceae bacterium]|nr:hypothetical protein [Planctomycetaceae bacterium]
MRCVPDIQCCHESEGRNPSPIHGQFGNAKPAEQHQKRNTVLFSGAALRWLTLLAAFAFRPALALAQEVETQSFQATELDLPESTAGILIFGGLISVLFWIAFRTSWRDSRFLKTPWRLGLLIPRLLVLILVVAITLNPRQRTQVTRIEKSRVGILVDTSSSMAFPAMDVDQSGNQAPPDAAVPQGMKSRNEAVTTALIESGLLGQLARTHAVSVYTFDSTLRGPVANMNGDQLQISDAEPNEESGEEAVRDTPGKTTLDLSEQPEAGEGALLDSQSAKKRLSQLMQATGSETRLGESLHQLIGQISGRTLSGVVVLTDGRSNAGIDTSPARVRAERSGTRLITVGVGSQRPQINLWLAGMQSPADVHKGDPFDINVVVQGTGIQNQQVLVRLFQQSAGSDGKDRKQVDEASVTIADEKIPVSLRFTQQLPVPGKYEFVARTEVSSDSTGGVVVTEMTLDDNERRREVEVTDRKIRVLLISSGPMRDYQFVRNTLFRHSGIESDVWLQTVTVDDAEFVTQEAANTLTQFPSTEAQLFEYDVIVAFDPDWSRLSGEQQQYLNRWVAEHSGGMVLVAGDIYTPRMAKDAEAYRNIAVLYPVLLNRMLPELQLTQRSDQPWPLKLTPEGQATEFLKIADASGTATTDLWKTFKGIYRSYPIRGLRDGAVTLLEYGNPRARTEIGQPPFLASQFFGSGRTVFLGSAETWRLREISPQGHQRFWTSLIREVGQGRRSRGNARGLLLLDRNEASPGQSVNIRAQLYDQRLQPLQSDSVTVSIIDADGRPVSVPDQLNNDGRGTGQFRNNFRPPRPGVYRISVPVPESSDVLTAMLEVVRPNLESQNATQDVAGLMALTENNDGKYLSIAEAMAELPDLLPDRSEPVIIDEQLRTLWDRSWLMYLMIALLALEWGLRRVVRLS